MTSDTQLRAELNQLNLEDLRRKQLEVGRASLPQEFLKLWWEQNARAESILQNPQHGVRLKELAYFLKTISASLAAFAIERVPTYYPYTDVHVLDWFIGKNHEDFSKTKSRAIAGIFHLIKDLVEYEAQSLTGFRTSNRQNFEKSGTVGRLGVLAEMNDSCERLGRQLMGEKWPPDEDAQHFKNLDGYVGEPHRISGLLYFSCFPQTSFHDEILFLRVIHISELCFFGIRFSVMEAIENLRYQACPRAVESLAHACGFAVLLQKGFKVLRTMTPERFKDFRDATGKASAIQSRNYQLMEAYFRGMPTDKKEHFSSIGHLRFMNHFQHKSFLHLGRAIEQFSATPLLMETAKELDRRLLSWRGAHLGFAKLYLADVAHGTGDTSGAPYLQKFLGAGLFADTKLDMEILEDMLPGLGEFFQGVRVPTHKSIAVSGSEVAQPKKP